MKTMIFDLADGSKVEIDPERNGFNVRFFPDKSKPDYIVERFDLHNQDAESERKVNHE